MDSANEGATDLQVAKAFDIYGYSCKPVQNSWILQLLKQKLMLEDQ